MSTAKVPAPRPPAQTQATRLNVIARSKQDPSKVAVSAAGFTALQAASSDRLLGVAAYGGTRVGKSTFLSHLANTINPTAAPVGAIQYRGSNAGVFPASSSADPLTMGVDIARIPLGGGDGRCVTLLDTEGTGSNEDGDEKFVVPALLTSEVVLFFTTKPAAAVFHIVDELEPVMAAAQKVTFANKGRPGSTPTGKLLGHLHVVINKSQLDGVSDATRAAFLTPKEPPPNAKRDNYYRLLAVHGAFASVSLHVLPDAVASPGDYRTGVANIWGVVRGQLGLAGGPRQPGLLLGGAPVTCGLAASTMAAVCDVFNSGKGEVHVPSLMSHVFTQRALAVIAPALQRLQAADLRAQAQQLARTPANASNGSSVKPAVSASAASAAQGVGADWNVLLKAVRSEMPNAPQEVLAKAKADFDSAQQAAASRLQGLVNTEVEALAKVEAQKRAEAERLAKLEAQRKAEAERQAKLEAERRAEQQRQQWLAAQRQAEYERKQREEAEREARRERERREAAERERERERQREQERERERQRERQQAWERQQERERREQEATVTIDLDALERVVHQLQRDQRLVRQLGPFAAFYPGFGGRSSGAHIWYG